MPSEVTAVHLDEIGQIALTVANLEEAKTFYRDVLGMKFLFDAGTMTFFQCGSVWLLIGAAEQGAEKPPGG
jgi:methylmalonyl-CoA/ethylmalonyl-CoA epimerase